MSLVRQAYAVIEEKLPTGAAFPPTWLELKNILGAAVNITFYVAIAICLIFMIVGGIKYATSGGDQKAAEAARGTITSAVIGFVVVVGFRFILEIVISLLGAQLPAWLPKY